MAFDINRFVRVTLAYNSGRITTSFNPSVTPAFSNGPAIFSYASSVDTIAQVSAANYFSSQVYQLAVGDIIIAVASDASNMLQVSAVDRDAGTIAVVGFAPSGVVDTANIADGAITNAKVNAAAAIAYSKLATMATGSILLGNAGVPTATALTGDVTVGATGVTAIGANKVLSSMISPLIRKYAAVAITAAEFNGMYAAPKLLVAAGGANTLLVLDQLQLAMTYVSANYAAGGVAAVQYDSTVNGAGVIASTTLAAATFQAAASSTFTMNAGVVVLPFTTTVNKGLYLSNITGAFTTGDSTFVAHVWYRVIPTV